MSSDPKTARFANAAPVSVRITKMEDAPASRPRTAKPAVRTTASLALVTTARRAPVRILVRPQAYGAIGGSLDGDAVIPVGPAAQSTWGGAWQPGDEEAIVWVLASNVNERLGEIRQNPRIVDVIVSMRDVK